MNKIFSTKLNSFEELNQIKPALDLKHGEVDVENPIKNKEILADIFEFKIGEYNVKFTPTDYDIQTNMVTYTNKNISLEIVYNQNSTTLGENLKNAVEKYLAQQANFLKNNSSIEESIKSESYNKAIKVLEQANKTSVFQNKESKNKEITDKIAKEEYEYNKRQYDGYQTIAKGNGKYSYEPLYQSKSSKTQSSAFSENEKTITPETEQRKEQIRKNISNLEYLLELLNTSENIKQVEAPYTQDTLVEYAGKKHSIKDINTTADGRTVYHLEDEHGNPIQEGGVKRYVGKDNLIPWTEKEKVVSETTASVKEQLEKIQNDGATLVVLDPEEMSEGHSKTTAPKKENLEIITDTSTIEEPKNKEGGINKNYFGTKFLQTLKEQKELHIEKLKNTQKMIRGEDYPPEIIDLLVLKIGINEFIKQNETILPEKIIQNLHFYLNQISSYDPSFDFGNLQKKAIQYKNAPHNKELLEEIKTGMGHVQLKYNAWVNSIVELHNTLAEILPEAMIHELRLRSDKMFSKQMQDTIDLYNN